MMNETKLILMNGAPGAGKDFAANLISKEKNIQILSFAKELKDMVHAAYGFHNIKYDYFETTKDSPNLKFDGKSPRDAYINFAENYIKPFHGKEYFVKKIVDKINNEKIDICIISDLGFIEELEELLRHFHKRNILLFQIYTLSEHKRTDSDSRKYIEIFDNNGQVIYPGMRVCTLFNNRDKMFEKQVLDNVDAFLNINILMENDYS